MAKKEKVPMVPKKVKRSYERLHDLEVEFATLCFVNDKIQQLHKITEDNGVVPKISFCELEHLARTLNQSIKRFEKIIYDDNY